MTLKSILLSVLIVLAFNSCTPKLIYIQPDMPILATYHVKSIGNIAYDVVPELPGKIVVNVEDFSTVVSYTKKLRGANQVLNDEIKKYNKYAKGLNEDQQVF